MLSNAYFLAKFRFDTAENEPYKVYKILPILLILLTLTLTTPNPRGPRNAELQKRVAEAAHGLVDLREQTNKQATTICKGGVLADYFANVRETSVKYRQLFKKAFHSGIIIRIVLNAA